MGMVWGWRLWHSLRKENQDHLERLTENPVRFCTVARDRGYDSEKLNALLASDDPTMKQQLDELVEASFFKPAS
jgi:hypothetical protein